MQVYNPKTGFTLIELLVVVLIIGILAAVALPQYQKAVAKSRGVQVIAFLNAYVKAAELHALEHGCTGEEVLLQTNLELSSMVNNLGGSGAYMTCGYVSAAFNDMDIIYEKDSEKWILNMCEGTSSNGEDICTYLRTHL